MSSRFVFFLCISRLLLVVLSFLFQLIALFTSRWASFSARTDLGKPEEKGHYGLWTLCSTKGPHWVEDCDPLDTFYQLPPYSKVSGVLGILHLVFLLGFIPLVTIRIVKMAKNNRMEIGIKRNHLAIAEAFLILISTFIAVVVAALISYGENQKEYVLIKGWSFWLQISVIIFDAIVSSLCVFERIRLLRLHFQQQIDPTGKRAETYGNPSFDTESPNLPRASHSNNGAIAFTESSGLPYDPEPITAPKSSTDKSIIKAKKSKENGKDTFETLTYENECYQESSPTVERSRTRRH